MWELEILRILIKKCVLCDYLHYQVCYCFAIVIRKKKIKSQVPANFLSENRGKKPLG